jgi:glycosyltransferase involved in cell wall biosynthesis
VFYADKKYLTNQTLNEMLQNINSQCIYLNGIFSFRFFLLPLWVLKGTKLNYKIVVCPRGMLQSGALAVKPFKKKLYLLYLRLSGFLKNAYWHATNEEELQDIQNHFAKNKGVVIASNIPKLPRTWVATNTKITGHLRLIYLSLITEKKNLLGLLQVIKETGREVSIDIYGPVKDQRYWAECKKLIQLMPEKATYKGDVQPEKVQEVLSTYDAFILLTKGENFGHALYESLSVGRPVITSHFTPWSKLLQKKAGWNVNIEDKAECINLINELVNMGPEQWNIYCVGASKVSKEYFNNVNVKEKYAQLFSK